VLGAGAYAIYTVRSVIPFVGLVLVVAIVVGVVVSLLCGIVFLARRVADVEVIQVGQYGTYVRWFGRYKRLEPVRADSRQSAAGTEPGVQRVYHIPASIGAGREELEFIEESDEQVTITPVEEYKEIDSARETSVLLGGTDDLLGKARLAYAEGYRSRNKLSEYLVVSPHRAIQLIAAIKSERNDK
jgi:hypothetical protein